MYLIFIDLNLATKQQSEVAVGLIVCAIVCFRSPLHIGVPAGVAEEAGSHDANRKLTHYTNCVLNILISAFSYYSITFMRC